jgi:hypothetical protein
MSTADIVAYIGAAAWVPQILTWLYKAWAKPRVSVSPAPTVDLTYDDSGPVVTLAFSISVERHDVIIESMELHMRHEHGDERTLSWVTAGDLSGQSSAPVTAIKVATTGLSDLRVIFRDIKSSKELRKRRDEIINQFNFLCTSMPNPLELVLKSKEAHEARLQSDQSWYWKPGKYNFDVMLRSKAGVHFEELEIYLSQADSDFLKQNCELFPEFLSAVVLEASGQPASFPKWKWLTSGIARRSR